MINIVIADDHKMFLDGLVAFIEKLDDIKCVGTATDGASAFLLPEQNHIDVAVLDIKMPFMDGIELTKALREKYPEIKVLILSMHKEKEQIQDALAAGAFGYIIKEKGGEELELAIRTIMNGKNYYSESIPEIIMSSLGDKVENAEPIIELTKREIEILKLLVQGLSGPQIATQLFVTEATVASHRRNLHSKFDVSNVAQLIDAARKNGVIND
jgi:two-component system nitrate/nitrite response regulator NarL